VSDAGRLSNTARAVWAESFLARLPDPATERLLADARELRLATGETFYRGTHHEVTERAGLVTTGLLRTFRRAPGGRQVTLRYAPPGALIGLPAVLGQDAEAEGQALQDSVVVVLPAATVRAVAQRDARVAWSLATYLASVLQETNALLATDLFGRVRARVARHLLDMATAVDGQLVVTATHQSLADAIGSVREVVSRALKQLQEDGAVARHGRRLVLADPAALHRAALDVL
jgi:CRP-like cAMP-binding protein